MSAPNIFAGLLRPVGDVAFRLKLKPSTRGETGGLRSGIRPALRSGFRSCLDAGNVEDDERRLKVKRFEGFGGSWGRSSELELPVRWTAVGRVSVSDFVSYFWRIYLSMTPSTSSISIGMAGFTFRELYE
jgi:hypothetical protein